MPTRAQAVAKVKQGDVLAAVVIPHDLASRLSSSIAPARLEVIYNGDALEQSLVQSTLNSALAQANLGFSEQIQQAAAQAIDQLLTGGNLGVLGAPPNLIGLSQIPPALQPDRRSPASGRGAQAARTHRELRRTSPRRTCP